MKKLKWLLIPLIGILIGAGLAFAVEQYRQWLIPQTATISDVSFAMYIDSILWNNNTLLDWGILDAGGSYTQNLTIVNTSNINATFYLITTTLPSAWSESWGANATILMPTQAVSGDWTLTVAASATPGASYSWNTWINATAT